MRLAYVDSSCLVAIAFGEPGHRALTQKLAGFDRLLTCDLTEAELLSALRREDVEGPGRLLDGLTFVFPDRRLTREYEQVLAEGYQKGADLIHLACALFLRADFEDLEFVTADPRQQAIANSLRM